MRTAQYREHRVELLLAVLAVLPEQRSEQQSLRNPA